MGLGSIDSLLSLGVGIGIGEGGISGELGGGEFDEMDPGESAGDSRGGSIGAGDSGCNTGTVTGRSILWPMSKVSFRRDTIFGPKSMPKSKSRFESS